MIWLRIKSTDHRGNDYVSKTQAYWDLECKEWLNEAGEPVHGSAPDPDFSNVSFVDMARMTSPYTVDTSGAPSD